MEKIMKMLKKLIRKIYPATKLEMDAVFRNQEFLKRSIINTTPMPLIHFSIHLTEHCNLNCCGCSHFCNLHKEPEFLDLKEFERDFARLSELFHGEAEYIHLMGGEPLLHPQITDMFPIARKSFPHADLKILTNGILLPKMQDSFWNACRENNIIITPSQFPIKVDYREVQRKAEHFGVRCLLVWEKSEFRKDVLDLDGFHDPLTNFLKCTHPNNCTFFSHGRFCTCNIPLNIGNFNTFFHKNLRLSEQDYIDIYKAKSGQEILSFLTKPIPFCRYCALEKWERGLAWKVSKQEISEWI